MFYYKNIKKLISKNFFLQTNLNKNQIIQISKVITIKHFPIK